MNFSKMHGLGNDFMVVDAITQNVSFSKEIIRRLSHRKYGIGFDQLLIVESSFNPEIDFNYRIFNADGEEVSQCGNGARCFARFVRMKNLTNKQDIYVSTRNRNLIISIQNDEKIYVNMGEPIFDPKKVPFLTIREEKQYIINIDKKKFYVE